MKSIWKSVVRGIESARVKIEIRSVSGGESSSRHRNGK